VEPASPARPRPGLSYDRVVGTRWFAIAVSVALIGATVSPVLKNPNDDSFPLSTYPMFAWKRSTTITMEYVVGFTASGERWHLPPRAIGSSEPMQAKRILEGAAAGGLAGMRALCERAAARVTRFRADIVVVAMMVGTHEAVDYLVYDRRGAERELVRCPVPGHEAEAKALAGRPLAAPAPSTGEVGPTPTPDPPAEGP